jgi:hypothetical protein
MDVPVARSQGDFNIKTARGVRGLKIDMGNIVKPQHRLSSRAESAENPPDFFLVMGRNRPVNMNEIGIHSQQDHLRFLIAARQFHRFALQRLTPLFRGLDSPLLGRFDFVRNDLGRNDAPTGRLGLP